MRELGLMMVFLAGCTMVLRHEHPNDGASQIDDGDAQGQDEEQSGSPIELDAPFRIASFTHNDQWQQHSFTDAEGPIACESAHDPTMYPGAAGRQLTVRLPWGLGQNFTQAVTEGCGQAPCATVRVWDSLGEVTHVLDAITGVVELNGDEIAMELVFEDGQRFQEVFVVDEEGCGPF